MDDIDKNCPECGTNLKRYDSVKRIVRGKNHSKRLVAIDRYKCSKCKTIHRDTPDCLYPFKQYDSEIINGVLEGLIGPDVLGFEDFPCEETMKRWKKQGLKPRL